MWLNLTKFEAFFAELRLNKQEFCQKLIYWSVCGLVPQGVIQTVTPQTQLVSNQLHLFEQFTGIGASHCTAHCSISEHPLRRRGCLLLTMHNLAHLSGSVSGSIGCSSDVCDRQTRLVLLTWDDSSPLPNPSRMEARIRIPKPGTGFSPLQEGRIHPYPLECVFEHNPDTERLDAGIFVLTDLTVDRNTYTEMITLWMPGTTLTYMHYSVLLLNSSKTTQFDNSLEKTDLPAFKSVQ